MHLYAHRRGIAGLGLILTIRRNVVDKHHKRDSDIARCVKSLARIVEVMLCTRRYGWETRYACQDALSEEHRKRTKVTFPVRAGRAVVDMSVMRFGE